MTSDQQSPVNDNHYFWVPRVLYIGSGSTFMEFIALIHLLMKKVKDWLKFSIKNLKLTTVFQIWFYLLIDQVRIPTIRRPTICLATTIRQQTICRLTIHRLTIRRQDNPPTTTIRLQKKMNALFLFFPYLKTFWPNLCNGWLGVNPTNLFFHRKTNVCFFVVVVLDLAIYNKYFLRPEKRCIRNKTFLEYSNSGKRQCSLYL